MMPSLDTLQRCAPMVAPTTIAAIIQIESGGNSLAIGVNAAGVKKPHPKTIQEAVIIASYYIQQGYTVDLGLMQINSRNLKGLGLTLEQALDPCQNIQAGSRILTRSY